jgi:hypothetical protein
MSKANTFSDQLGQDIDAVKLRAKDYEQLLSHDVSQLARAFAWRAVLALGSLILAIIGLTLAGVSVLLCTSFEGLSWHTHPATWAVPLAFLVGSATAALVAALAPTPSPLAATRLRLAEDAARVDQRARAAVREFEDRLQPVRRLWKDVESKGVVGTASQGVQGVVSQWWQRQPIRPAASAAVQEARQTLEPLAKSHPWLLISLAVAAGSVMTAVLPRRWLRRLELSVGAAARPWLAAVGPALVTKAVSGLNLRSLASLFMQPSPSPPAHEPDPAPKPVG